MWGECYNTKLHSIFYFLFIFFNTWLTIAFGILAK